AGQTPNEAAPLSLHDALPISHVGVFTGATSTSDVQYRVEQGGKLVVRSVYHEVSSTSPQGILLDDSGTLSIDATRFSYQTSAERSEEHTSELQSRENLVSRLL